MVELSKLDLAPAQNTLKTVSGIAQVAEQSGGNLKDLNDFAKTVQGIITQIQQMQNMRQSSGQAQGNNSFSGSVKGSPANYPPLANVAPQNPSIQIIEREIDPDKLSAGLKDILKNVAPKMLPEDIKKLPINMFIGENLSNFKTKVAGLDATGDQLIEIFASQLVDQIKRCYK